MKTARRLADLETMLRRGAVSIVRRVRGVHRDQQGTISILSTFAMLMFTMLLLLVTNVALQVDDKVKMQNAADSAAYSGGVVIARGMNAIAFGNHLESDILGLVAFLREARDQNAIQFVPTILEQWRQAGAKFGPARFPKFMPLPMAIPDKSDKELELATAWSEMSHAAAEFALPVFEYILGTPENEQTNVDDHLIPNFQRAVIDSIPGLAQAATNEVALRHGVPAGQRLGVGPAVRNSPQSAANNRSPQFGVLWRTSVQPVGLADESDPTTRTLPVVDPDPSRSDYYRVPNGANLLDRSVQVRNRLAREYLEDWIEDDDLMRGLGFFDDEAKMSTLQALYRITTCAYLNELLDEEFPTTNVPIMLRNDFGGSLDDNEIIERDYTFVSLAYRAHVNEMGPRMFRNPIDQNADAVTFSQVSVYIPRFMYAFRGGRWWGVSESRFRSGGQLQTRYGYHHWTNGWPTGWNLFNQNWTVRLTPATSDSIPEILQSNPGGYASNVRPPNLGGATMQDIDAVNTH